MQMDNNTTITPADTSSQTPTALPSIKTLLNQSFTFARQRLDLVGWYALSMLGFFILVMLPFLVVLLDVYLSPFTELPVTALLIVAAICAYGAAFWLLIVSASALAYASVQGDTTTFKVGWGWAKQNFWAIVWLCVPLSLVFLAGFSLLVIPAFVILIYSLFYFMAFIRSDQRGLHTLAASTHVVYGRFWSVVLRMVIVMLLFFVMDIAFISLESGLSLFFWGAPLLIAFSLSALLLVANLLASFFLSLVTLRYMALLYEALTVSTAPYQPSPRSHSYRIYQALCLFGVAIIVAGVVATFIFWTQIETLLLMPEPTMDSVWYDESLSDEELDVALEAFINAEPE